MRLDLRALAYATGTVAAVLYVLCALLVAVAPVPFTRFVGYGAHVDPSGLLRAITWGSFCVGLVAWTVFCVASVTLTAGLYNRWARG